jgi:hypothetical protein
VPGSPGLQAISFNTSCETEIAPLSMQAPGQVVSGNSQGPQTETRTAKGAPNGLSAPPWRPVAVQRAISWLNYGQWRGLLQKGVRLRIAAARVPSSR